MAIIKRLKNNSGSNRIIINRDIADQAYYYIHTNLWVEVLEDLDLLDDISSGQLIVNDGSTDLSSTDGIIFLNKFEGFDIDDSLISNDRIKVEVTGSLSDGTVKVSTDDASGFLEDKISAGSSKVSKTTVAGETVQIDIVPSNINTSELNNDNGLLNETSHGALPQDNPHSVTKAQVGLGNADNTSDINKPVSTAGQTALDLKYNANNPSGFETPLELDSRDSDNRNRANHTGTQLSSTISDFDASVKLSETTTSIVLAANILTYTDEDGSDTAIDLSVYLDDTNLARLVSGTLNSSTGVVTFTRDDASTFTIDFSDIIPTVQIHNVISVSKDGNDTTGDGSLNKPYLTVTKAVDIANGQTPSASNHLTIEIGPGLFVEAPITMDSYTSMIGKGGRTTLIASNSAADFITMKDNMTLSDVILTGVTDTSKYLVNVSASTSGLVAIARVVLASSSNGIKTTSSSGQIITVVNEVTGSQISGNTLSGQSGSELILDSGLFIGNGTTSVAIAQDGGDISIYNARIRSSLSALDVKSNSGKVKLYSLDVDENTIPLRQTGTAGIFVNGGRVDLSKAEVIETSVIEGLLYSEVEGENTVTILSELAVGVPGKGRESCFGEGDSFTNGLFVYTYDGSSFVSKTAEARSVSGSNFTFPSTSVGDCIYISHAFPEEVTGNRLKWFGTKPTTDTASVGGEIVAEYWDGSSWIEFNTMSTGSSGKYLPHGKDLFQRTGPEHVRFDYSIGADWTASDPVSIGISLYWVRFRIATTLTTAPIFEQMKIHANRTEINGDGFMEFFGNARPLNILPFDSGTFQAANNSPTNQDLWLGDSIGVGRIENQFVSGTTDRVGLVRPLPLDLDTSSPLKVILHLHSEISDVSPDIDFTIRYAKSNTGSSVYDSTGLAPSTAVGQNTITGSVTNPGIDKQFSIEFYLDISDFKTRDVDNIGDLFWMTIQRDNDGNASDISLIQVEMQYLKWCNGGHI